MTSKRGRTSAADMQATSLGVVDLTGARIAPPDHLTDAELAEWTSIVDSLPADYFRPSDVSLLAAYCTAAAFYREAKHDLQTNGITLIDPVKGRRYANPASTILSTQGSAMAQMAVKLRLAPSSRMSEQKAGNSKNGGSKPAGGRPWEQTGTDDE